MENVGAENEELQRVLGSAFNKQMALMSMTKGVKSGVHIQSCGHHMHYTCRKSYCDTLKQANRLPREQPLDTESGEFICPVCRLVVTFQKRYGPKFKLAFLLRQLANSLLPIPPEESGPPVTLFPNNEHERTIAIGKSIYDLLKEGPKSSCPNV